MLNILYSVIYVVICLSISAQGTFAFESDDANTHFANYSNFNKTSHDNIDDTFEDHSHKHKHSEDGEEHEHEHSHVKITQSNIKLITSGEIVNFNHFEDRSSQIFSEETLLSNPHPFGIFRPPRV